MALPTLHSLKSRNRAMNLSPLRRLAPAYFIQICQTPFGIAARTLTLTCAATARNAARTHVTHFYSQMSVVV
jgi:hypothetical protein